MAKTKFFRVAVEGPTVDGRNIDRSAAPGLTGTQQEQKQLSYTPRPCP